MSITCQNPGVSVRCVNASHGTLLLLLLLLLAAVTVSFITDEVQTVTEKEFGFRACGAIGEVLRAGERSAGSCAQADVQLLDLLQQRCDELVRWGVVSSGCGNCACKYGVAAAAAAAAVAAAAGTFFFFRRCAQISRVKQ